MMHFTGRMVKQLSVLHPTVRVLLFVSLILTFISLYSLSGLIQLALAANPAPLQTYMISMPEDDTLAMFYADGGGNTARSPMRSVTYISIGTDGTLVYYDQWEDGSYDSDIANPGANVYNASTNPDGTQVWGDGVLGNGCPPNLSNTPNPCSIPQDDIFENGDVIVLDNYVTVQGAPGGPYSRNASEIFFDGRDRLGATLPVAVARALWPSIPGSLMAGGVEVLDNSRLGTTYTSPIGENIVTPTNAFEDVRWFIIGNIGGATINVDANGDGDVNDAGDLNNYALAAGGKVAVDGIRTGATLTVVNGNPVQVNLLSADVGDTYEFRWDALLPNNEWKNDYYSPVGTTNTAANGCTEVWLYNPGGSAITVNYDFRGGLSPDGTINLPARSAARSPVVPRDSGARFYTASASNIFLPISITDCTQSGGGGQINDWDAPLFPAGLLTPEVLVGWAPGCTNESYDGICLDNTDNTRTVSRNVVWVTPLANTTLYVDHNGSGITCPAGTGADQTIPATALNSYRINNDPGSRTYVHDNFGSVAYNRNDTVAYPSITSSTWATNWTETGDDGAPGSGSIWITGNVLQFRGTAGNETGFTLQRTRSLAGQVFSRLSFRLQSSAGLDANDDIAVDVSGDGGSTWSTLEQIQGPLTTQTTKVYAISPYNSASTTIRFRLADDLENGDTWNIDDVHIDNAPNGDFDMTGAYIRTCDDTPFAAAYGQDPSLSFSSDEEALDLGTFIPPYGARIRIDKVASASYAAPGEPILYTYSVRTILNTTVNNVRVEDNLCEPEVYVSGDDGDSQLEPGETWIYTCSSKIYIDSTNTAYACALIGAGEICSAPDQSNVAVRGAVGDYVWIDEDGDGDQDAGEPGIPNVRITLSGTDMSGNAVNLSTYTDADGRYHFANVPPSNASGYTVTVSTSSLPPGLAANPTYDENGTGTPNTTGVVLGSEVEYMSADFGYNWSPPGSTNGNSGTGAIGDRVWIDANGDGQQDPGEPGLNNVPVQLIASGIDGIFFTADDVEAATISTDHTGNYIFDDLGTGAYVVRLTPPAGYLQTGDPDATLDHQTTIPILLAPGDVFLNADFGYHPDNGTGAAIGDTLWIDANGNNTLDGGESTLPGVTVSLIRDLNGNRIWEAGEPIIATQVTSSNGQYQFNNLPVADGNGTDDYLVWVNDTANLLPGLTASYDSDGSSPASGLVTGLGISAVADLAGDNFVQDFGYVPRDHNAGDGLIGDTIWLDSNNDGSFNPGEGLEDVLVVLLDNARNVITRLRTNENGQYFFGDLAAGTYTVQVDYNTLPGYGLGLSNFLDPDGGAAHESTLTLAAGGINLAQDFGYRALIANTIGGTLWQDTDADGTRDAAETSVFSGVTVALYEDTNLDGRLDHEDRLVGTKTTDVNGNYSFTDLPDSTYFVGVVDSANRLNGYWHSDGPNHGADGNSQYDPYTIIVRGGQTDLTGDFGYYRDPAHIGDYVWEDLNFDGLQDPGEPGIPNASVTLSIAWPNGGTTILTTITDASGNYSFGNLLLDEDFDGVGAGEPAFTVTFTAPATYRPTTANVGSDDAIDSDGSAADAAVVKGETNSTIDSGFKRVVWIGDTLWLDLDSDGVLDANEPGLSGVNVFLDFNSNGSWEVGEPLDTTDANGLYSFDDLAVGTYFVTVDAATLPGGVIQTWDPDGILDNKHTLVANSPGAYDYVDFGYQSNGSIGDFVWNDLDGDGVQDAGEAGIGGVNVWVDLNHDGVQGPTEPASITNSNGRYTITGLPAGTYTVRTNGVPISGATPTYDLDGAGTPNTAVVILAAGETRSDVDFGYQYAALSISKASSAGGSTQPGNTIQYTIVVRNNTPSQQTGIVIADPLPAGTTYTAQSTVATGYQLGSGSANYRDVFNARLYTNNNGTPGWNWTGNWTEVGENDGAQAGYIQVYDDGTGQPREYVLGVNKPNNDNVTITRRVYRQANLSTCTSAILTLDYRRQGPENGENMLVEASPDNLNYTTIFTILGQGSTDANYLPSGNISLNGYLGVNLYLRFSASFSGNNRDAIFVDNIQITCNYQTLTPVTKDNIIPGGVNPDLSNGAPPNLVVAGDNFALNPGQSMQVTFRVAVNNPVALPSIDNTASVISNQQLTPQTSSTQDDLPRANLGNWVWNDEDGDGIQDGGELGISNLAVSLYSPGPDGVIGGGDDVLVNTAHTDSGGNFAFSNLIPRIYYLEFEHLLIYNFSPMDAGGDDTLDSDADQSTGRTALFPAYAGTTDNDLDAGLVNAALDYDDLPNSYGTLYANNGAFHVISDVYLGNAVDSEANGNPTPDGMGDGVDDDGVIIQNPGHWTPGGSAQFTVTVTDPDGTAYLLGWFDWNNDGDFADAGEPVTFGDVLVGRSVVAAPLPASFTPGQIVFARYRLYDSQPAIGSSTGGVSNGEVEGYQYTPPQTTPVTLSYFATTRSEKGVHFEWSTSTETGNVGFKLYVQTLEGLVLLHPDLIASPAVDSLQRLDYQFDADNVDGTTFYLEDWSILGQARLRGPFELDKTYGERVDEERIDWEDIQRQNQAALAGSEGSGSKLQGPLTVQSAQLRVDQDGLYRVTYEALLAAGVDLGGVPLKELALTNRGQAVPIRAETGGFSSTNREVFGPGAFIEFYGQALDTLYTGTNVYLLERNLALAARIPLDSSAPDPHSEIAPYYLETVTVDRQRAYAFYTPTGNPWYDTSMLTYKTSKSWIFGIQVDGYLPGASPATLFVDLWGVTDWSQSPDHHASLSFNNAVVADQIFDGLAEMPINVQLPEGSLKAGENKLQITLPGDTGVDYDMVDLDRFSVSFPRQFLATKGYLAFNASARRFKVDGLPTNQAVVYRLDENGLVRLANVLSQPTPKGYAAIFAGMNQPADYLVSDVMTLRTPGITQAPAPVNLQVPADYLIIAHPAFLSGLQRLVDYHQANGLNVSVVNVMDLYNAYSGGIFDPSAIQAYIRYASQSLGVRYVLLVGGDTYDYRNYINKAAYSFIPSLYAQTHAVVRLAPADPLYADVDSDGLTDLPLGRFPVRTPAELDSIIQKTLAYANKDYGQTGVFAADRYDGLLSFSGISDQLIAGLPSGWTVDRAYLDTLGVAQARSLLINSINQGRALTTFVGHSGLNVWTFERLFTTTDAAALTNAGRPTLVVQWGCWNTYYVSPDFNTLAHKFLLSGDRGAAAVLGATALTQADSEALLGGMFTPYLTQQGMTVGDALQAAKHDLALSQPYRIDVLLGWTLLGDPALIVTP